MAAQKGSSFLVKVGDSASPETFTTVGGFATNTITLDEQAVDITNKSSSARWREQVRFGVKSVSIGGNGRFIDDAPIETLRANFFGSAILNFQLVVPDLGTFEGAFIITQLQFDGADKDAVNQAIALESAGAVTFTAA